MSAHLVERELHYEDRPPVRPIGLGPYEASVQGDHSLGDVEAEAAATAILWIVGIRRWGIRKAFR